MKLKYGNIKSMFGLILKGLANIILHSYSMKYYIFLLFQQEGGHQAYPANNILGFLELSVQDIQL